MLGLLQQIAGAFNKKVYDFCDLETTDQGVLIAKDGSVASIIEISGLYSLFDASAFHIACDQLAQILSVFLEKPFHSIQAIYQQDYEPHELLGNILARKKSTVARLGLEIDSLLEEQYQTYGQTHQENYYWVLWSKPGLLSQMNNNQSDVQKNVEILRSYQNKESQFPYPILNQQHLLIQQHQAFCQSVVGKFKQLGVLCEELDVSKMLYSIKKQLLPKRTPDNWLASTPHGNPLIQLPLRAHQSKTFIKDLQKIQEKVNILYPSIAKQIMNAPAYEGGHGDVDDETVVKFGERIYIPILFEVLPNQLHYFSSLLNQLKAQKTPYFISFLLEGGAMSGFSLNDMLASFMGYISAENALIEQTKKALNDYKLHSPLTNIKIAATTWVDITEVSKEKNRSTEVVAQKARFMKTLQAWGNPIVIDKIGSPMQALQSAALCLSHQSIANRGVLPLADALKILPGGRPAQIFKEGSQIFQSIDGKILPFQRFSSMQTTWITLITGRPGFGKSVLLNDLHLELCCSDGLNELPYICSIDIGMSSKGIIELLQQSLPPEKRSLLMYARLQNSLDFAINPFDTPVGCRYPLPKDKSFLINFVTILSTPAERKGHSFQGMNDLIARLVDLVYQYKADDRDRAYPNLYIPGHHPELDQKVDRYFQQYPERYSPSLNYWRLTDLFFEEGDILSAEIAQRYAVPILDDLISIAASYDVQQEFQEMVTEQGVSLLETLQNNLRSAIGQFPILSNYTRFDIGASKIMSLDLNDVTAQGGSDQNLKNNALMYMMARQCFMKKVAYSKEDLHFIPQKYQRYYDQLIKKLIDSKKSLCYDEYHRTGNIKALEQQTLLDARESRKWQMELIIASQFLQDMGQLTDIATNIFLCDAGTQSSRLFIKQSLGLTEAQESKLIEYAQGPSAKGMCFLGIQDTRDHGKIYQIYQFKVGPQRLWALSSTAEDRRLRQYLIDAGLPIRQVLELLAQKYPSGTCKKALEAYQRQLGQNSHELLNTADAEKNEQQGVEFLGQALLNEQKAKA